MEQRVNGVITNTNTEPTMTTTTTIPATQNEAWGFWGTMNEHASAAWPLAILLALALFPPVAAALGLDFYIGLVRRVLVVEDDAHLRQLFSLMVEGWDFPVELSTASDGFQGLVRIGQWMPDMVVTDLNMPGMNGFAALRALRRDPALCGYCKCSPIAQIGCAFQNAARLG